MKQYIFFLQLHYIHFSFGLLFVFVEKHFLSTTIRLSYFFKHKMKIKHKI